MKLSSFTAIAAATLLSSTAAYAAEDAGARFTAALDGDNEVAPVVGDPDGQGTATIRVNYGRSQVCYSISVVRIVPATAAHIHLGAAGINGGVVVSLMPPSSGTSQGCVTVERDLAKAILQNPSDYYVNVHNAEHSRGALRGQLGK